MKRIINGASLLVLALLAMTACTRRVQVESEPNEPRYMQSSSVAPVQNDMGETPSFEATRRS